MRLKVGAWRWNRLANWLMSCLKPGKKCLAGPISSKKRGFASPNPTDEYFHAASVATRRMVGFNHFPPVFFKSPDFR